MMRFHVADFFLQLENVRWTLVSGIVNGSFVMSVRNLGYMKNAGDFVRRYFVDIGSAGGHRAMAKAVVPLDAFQARFGLVNDNHVGERMTELLLEFLREAPDEKKRRDPVASQ
jgi:nanoRNase/pAp phosphatase (c-di-AMP/oligoRNAs hydrolase)